jgi:hypothetical protein
MTVSLLLVLGVLISFQFLFFLVTKLKYRSLRLPPGPRGWPILGSFFEMPASFEWLHWSTFKELYGEYIYHHSISITIQTDVLVMIGPVSSVTVLGKRVILLNSLKSCVDILEKKSSVSSGRPRMPFAGEL